MIRRAATVAAHRAREYAVGLLRDRPRLAAVALSIPRRAPRRWRPSLYRRLSWPLARALSTRLDVATAGGRMTVDSGDTVGCVLAVSGIWEPHVTNLFRAMVRPGDVVLDIGAHVGYYTLLGSRLVGDDGHIYAFEPSPARYAELCANVLRNGRTNVSTLEVAAGRADGTTTLFEAPRTNTSASTLVERAVASSGSYQPVPVRVARVDEVVARSELARTRIVKVDVEGFEVEALCGLSSILHSSQALCLFIEISPDWSGAGVIDHLESLCREHGFVPWRVRNEYTVKEYFPDRIEEPERIDAIPRTRADLVLARGVEPRRP